MFDWLSSAFRCVAPVATGVLIQNFGVRAPLLVELLILLAGFILLGTNPGHWQETRSHGPDSNSD
jgi:hypothetical protein